MYNSLTNSCIDVKIQSLYLKSQKGLVMTRTQYPAPVGVKTIYPVDVEFFLNGINTTPAQFGELCARATFLDESNALVEIEHAITRLRAQRAMRLGDTSQKKQPCEVEIYYGLDLTGIRRTITRQRHRRQDIALRRLNDTDSPASQRFLALEYLMEHINEMLERKRENDLRLLMCARRHELSLELFELYFYAYNENELDPSNASKARRQAAQLLRQIDAPEALGFAELKMEDWFVDDENAALERAFDRRYGEGSYWDLIMCYS